MSGEERPPAASGGSGVQAIGKNVILCLQPGKASCNSACRRQQ